MKVFYDKAEMQRTQIQEVAIDDRQLSRPDCRWGDYRGRARRRRLLPPNYITGLILIDTVLDSRVNFRNPAVLACSND